MKHKYEGKTATKRRMHVNELTNRYSGLIHDQGLSKDTNRDHYLTSITLIQL